MYPTGVLPPSLAILHSDYNLLSLNHNNLRNIYICVCVFFFSESTKKCYLIVWKIRSMRWIMQPWRLQCKQETWGCCEENQQHLSCPWKSISPSLWVLSWAGLASLSMYGNSKENHAAEACQPTTGNLFMFPCCQVPVRRRPKEELQTAQYSQLRPLA